MFLFPDCFQEFQTSLYFFLWKIYMSCDVCGDCGSGCFTGSSSYHRIVLVAVLQTRTLLFWEETLLLNGFFSSKPNSHSPQFYQGRAEPNHDQIPLEVSEKMFFIMLLDWTLLNYLLNRVGWNDWHRVDVWFQLSRIRIFILFWGVNANWIFVFLEACCFNVSSSEALGPNKAALQQETPPPW